MCGHVGVFGSLNPKAVHLFEYLLNLDMMRGKDGTGVLFVNRKTAEAKVVKGPFLPFQLMRSHAYLSEIHEQNVLLMGHNRAATKGVINMENTHPFEEGNIVLAHNGTLDGQHRLPDHKDYDNDSRNICHAVATTGLPATWKILEGAAALVFWDKESKNLSFINNGRRPFHFCYINDGDTIAWSSDLDFLKEAIERIDVKIKKMDAKNGKSDYFTLLDNHHYTFGINKKGKLFGGLGTELEKYTAPSTHVAYGYAQRKNETNWDNDANDPWGMYNDPDTAEGPHWQGQGGRRWRQNFVHRGGQLIETGQNVVPINSKKNQFPKPLEEEFHKIYKDCCFCGTDLKHDYLTCEVIDEKAAACNDCVVTGEKAGIQLRA